MDGYRSLRTKAISCQSLRTTSQVTQILNPLLTYHNVIRTQRSTRALLSSDSTNERTMIKFVLTVVRE